MFAAAGKTASIISSFEHNDIIYLIDLSLFYPAMSAGDHMFSSWKHARFADVNVRCCQSIQNKTIIMKPFLN